MPDERKLRPGRWGLALGLPLLVLTLIAFGFWRQGPEAGPGEGAFFAEISARGKAHADPAQCRECHQKETLAWEGSHHHLANASLSEADEKRLLEAEDPYLEERGIRWYREGGQIFIEEPGVAPSPVVGSIGLTPLIQYLHRAPDGRIQAHDVAWDVGKEEWFSVFEGEEGDPRVAGEWGHWTGQGMNWDANCAYCHMTEYAKNYDVTEDRYNVEWAHMGITCAQCHPGMDVHLAQVRNGNAYFKEELTAEQMMDYCAACHSLREELTPHAFRPGDAFEDHFGLTLASEPGLYHPDGQVIGENYVHGSLMMSRMGHAGVTCMDCHDPHTNGHILPVENNALCQRCHGSGLKGAPKINPTAHSRHPADSTGNRCVECHMPVTYFMGRDGRRDHSFSNPDPRLTLEMGIPNACSECHDLESVEWSRRHAEEWYGAGMNAERREKARLMTDLFDGREGAGERLRAALEEETNRFWKGTFLEMFRYAEPDPENLGLLLEATADPDPLIRAAAIGVAGLEALPRERARDLLEDTSRSVRLAASSTAEGMPVLSQEAETELEAYLEHTADSPMGALRLSAYRQSRGETEAAVEAVRLATQLEPLNAEAWRLGAIELHRYGETPEAVDYLQRARRLDPGNAVILYNLGLLEHERGNSRGALEHLRAAVAADRQLEAAWYNLVLLYWQLNERETALQELGKARVHLPGSERLDQLSRTFSGNQR
ncbi:MAG: multiheme c-type cytochrome [Oceanipulchritudo sp.]